MERAIRGIEPALEPEYQQSNSNSAWSKEKWESEWESNLSRDVAQQLHAQTSTQYHPDPSVSHVFELPSSPPLSCIGPPSFDPLHLPSLVVFSISMLGPLQSRLARSITDFVHQFGDYQLGVALVGGFCFGLGLGIFLR